MDDLSRPRRGSAYRWLRSSLLLALVLAAQGWQALRLFGDAPFARLTDSEPIVSGRHPVHFYHARLAAESWRSTGSPCGYDPALAAGYPRSAVVDAGARPFELIMLIARSDSAATYKVAVALSWFLLPLGYWAAARALGLRSTAAAATSGLVIVLGGSSAGQRLLHEGELNSALISTLAVLQLALLSRWHREPCPSGWLAMLATAAVGWFLQPVAWLGFTTLSIGCWAGMCRRHGPWWSAALVAIQCAAIAAVVPWLREWLRFWWIALPFPIATEPTTRDGWLPGALGLWTQNDRLACWLLICGGCLGGLVRKVRHDRRPAMYLLASGLLILSLAGAALVWEPLAILGARQWATLGLAFLVIPAGFAVSAVSEWLTRDPGRRVVPYLISGVVFCLGGAWLVQTGSLAPFATWGSRPHQFGLPEHFRSFAGFVRDNSRSTARILWEAPADPAEAPWLILLPDIIGRDFLLPPDRDADVEHSFAHLLNGLLAGRPIEAWSDVELDAFCRKYNVGTVVTATAKSTERFRRWPVAEQRGMSGEATWQFFEIRRPHSFVLSGSARAVDVDRRRVTLTDVVPENGEVVLSLHAVAGLRSRPGWVQVDREPDPFDPVPMLRLRLNGPAARLTLTWESP